METLGVVPPTSIVRATFSKIKIKKKKIMCTQPLTIKNPKKDFNKFNDKPFLVVPCGKCVECQQQKKLSYQIRAFYEYKYNLDHGGMTFFYTLTYNNKYLPSFDLPAKFSSQNYRIHCFNRDHIKRMVERIRKVYPNLVFLVTSEFGGQTRRPHYHVLFFVPCKVNPIQFYLLVSDCWSYNGKSLGNVYVGSDAGLVNSSHALDYVCKYVCKDDSYNDVFRKFSSAWFQSIYYNKYKIDDTYQYNKYLNKITPFVYKSMSFGKHALTYVQNIAKQAGTINFHNKDLPLPMYFFRKLYYNTEKDENGNTRYVLNDLGIERKIAILNRVVNEKVNKTISLYKYEKVPLELQNAIYHYSSLHFDYYTQIIDYIKNKVNLSDLFIYEYLYKDRLCTQSVTFIPSKDAKTFFQPFVMPFADARFIDDQDFMTFNQFSLFKGFDNYLQILKLAQIYEKFKAYVKRTTEQNSFSSLKTTIHGKDFHSLSKVKTIFEYSKLFNYAKQKTSDSFPA